MLASLEHAWDNLSSRVEFGSTVGNIGILSLGLGTKLHQQGKALFVWHTEQWT